MSKISIETSLKKNNIEDINLKTQGILQDGRIKYKEDKIMNILDIEKEQLERKTEEYKLLIDFKNEKLITEYLELNLSIIEKQKEQNKIKIKYKIEEDIFEYRIIWR
jgi:hypothetical protein